jgi:hypothetical protein
MTQISNAVRRMVHTLSIGCALAIVLGMGLVLAPGASAQVLYGSLTGTVLDASKAAVANAPVTVLDQGTGTTRATTTNAQGEYKIGDLQPGVYSVIVDQTGGFSKYTQKNVVVSVNQETRIDVNLQLSSVSAEVTVNTAAPMLQTEDAQVTHDITQSQIAELPITSSQGRNFQSLYSLIPGAAAVAEQNSTASNPSRAMSVNVNGVEYNSNTTRIDGAINYYGWLPYLVAYVAPADSIQTVNFATNSFNAEQGVAGGASVNIITKSGTRQFHGGVWEYNQLFNTNARPYTSAPPPAQIPKNIFNQFGFSIGGPVYIPKILTSKSKLFFFQDFERTTRRQLITGLQSVPTTPMINGDFSAVAGTTTLFDPQPGGVVQTGPNTTNGYLNVGFRPTFASEYPATGNAIPASRQSPAAQKMLALLKPITDTINPTTSQLAGQLANDYLGAGTLAYNRNTSDSKVNYNPTDRTGIFGRYSIEPFSVDDPQELGAAGGGTFDGGQPGAAAGRIQNVGLGMNHVITSHLVVDADFGYTRQVTGAQSTIDIAAGNFGLNTLGIPGTNGAGINYAGQPEFVMNGGSQFSSLGNSNGANPFLFRDNQFTGDVNVSWTRGRHSTKYGFTYYHFDLNHFQPTSGGGVSSPRGGFDFQGGMTANSGTLTAYNSLADFLLGLPNNGTGIAVAKETQLTNPNALRWTALAGYAQDQWSLTSKMTLNYGVRYEYYPAPYRDHQGVFRLDPSLPQSANVIAGGINGQPESAGINPGWGILAPRFGIAYRINDRTVVRTGAGITEDPSSMRFLRDEFPVDLSPTYVGSASNTISTDPVSGAALTLKNGIPPPVFPDFSSGFVSLPVSGSTNTVPKNYRRGYIESWNLFIEQDLGNRFVANIGYVGMHQVRQLIGLGLNSAPIPDGTSLCMANGQYNPSSPFFTKALGSNPCSFNANQTLNQTNCNVATGAVCYNTGGITMNEPLLSANYNALQSELSRNAGRLAQFGLVYTWSHAFNYEDNGAGSGSGGLPITFPTYFRFDRATASYDRTNNIQFWGIYHLPFGAGQNYINHGIMSAIFGGFQLNGQVSHVSGAPFSVSPSSSNLNSPGNTQYAELVKPYRQLAGHNRTAGATTGVGGGPWFDPTAFALTVPTPTYSATQAPSAIQAPRFGNTHRNEFRGPGYTSINASLFRGFHIYHESEFQVRFEAFNLLNHPQFSNPNATVTASTGNFGYITTFGNSRTLQFSGRFNF